MQPKKPFFFCRQLISGAPLTPPHPHSCSLCVLHDFIWVADSRLHTSTPYFSKQQPVPLPWKTPPGLSIYVCQLFFGGLTKHNFTEKYKQSEQQQEKIKTVLYFAITHFFYGYTALFRTGLSHLQYKRRNK